MPLQPLDHFYDVVERWYADDPAKQAAAAKQMGAFRNKDGAAWNRGILMSCAADMSAYQWWQQFGGHAPELQWVAVRLLSQVSSACACERNWSTFDFIHSERRNQLGVGKAYKLVYIFSNLRLLDKHSAEEFHEKFPAWRELGLDGEGEETWMACQMGRAAQRGRQGKTASRMRKRTVL